MKAKGCAGRALDPPRRGAWLDLAGANACKALRDRFRRPASTDGYPSRGGREAVLAEQVNPRTRRHRR